MKKILLFLMVVFLAGSVAAFSLFEQPTFLSVDGNFCDLNDVACTNLQNNQLAVYNSSTGLWENLDANKVSDVNNADFLDGIDSTGFIRTNGSSTTTAQIPFAQGIFIPTNKKIAFDGFFDGALISYDSATPLLSYFGGNAQNTDDSGGSTLVQAGDGDGAGNGGYVEMTAGSTGGSGNGGDIYITSGSSSSGNTGIITIQNASLGTPQDIFIDGMGANIRFHDGVTKLAAIGINDTNINTALNVLGASDFNGNVTVGDYNAGKDVTFNGSGICCIGYESSWVWDAAPLGLNTINGFMGINVPASALYNLEIGGTHPSIFGQRGITLGRTLLSTVSLPQGLTIEDTWGSGGTGTYPKYYGFNSVPTFAGDKFTGNFYGGVLAPTFNGSSASGPSNEIVGFSSSFGAGSGDINYAKAIEVYGSLSDANINHDVKLIDVLGFTSFSNSSIKENLWGLKVEDITQADGINYAIETGLGLVDFGDDVNAGADVFSFRSDGNVTMTSPNGSLWNCGVADDGSFNCN